MPGQFFPSPDTLKFRPYFRFSLSASASFIVCPNFVPLTPIMTSVFSESVLEGILRAWHGTSPLGSEARVRTR